MSTVTIPKTKYEDLKKKADAYEHIAALIERDLFSPPPTKNAAKIIGAFAKTGKYNTAFLASLKKGLARSSYFRK